jgi:hypothetical protein
MLKVGIVAETRTVVDRRRRSPGGRASNCTVEILARMVRLEIGALALTSEPAVHVTVTGVAAVIESLRERGGGAESARP